MRIDTVTQSRMHNCGRGTDEELLSDLCLWNLIFLGKQVFCTLWIPTGGTPLTCICYEERNEILLLADEYGILLL